MALHARGETRDLRRVVGVVLRRRTVVLMKSQALPD
jgi:hypothetical protein